MVCTGGASGKLIVLLTTETNSYVVFHVGCVPVVDLSCTLRAILRVPPVWFMNPAHITNQL